MGSYNRKSIQRKVIKSRAFSKSARKKVVNNVERAKRQMLDEFDNHPVTKEIAQGESSSNISRTLSGYGNLFTFLGFSQGSSPVSAVREALSILPRVKNSKPKRDSILFTISVPLTKDFRNVAQLPWESGRNWVEGIESGISGFSYYMSNLFGKVDKSRSGSAIQTEHPMRAGMFHRRSYMTAILNKFVNRISKRT